MEVPDNIAAWLRTVLFRAFIDGRRRANRRLLAEQSMLDQSTSALDHAAPEGESPRPALALSLEEANAIIASLPRHYREAYELYTFQHLSYEEIAVRLDVPAKTVGSRLNRARSRLRNLVQDRKRGRVGGSHVAG
jgi:RNA polymerase sigma-70 factor (ECF subfamily)